MKRLEPEIIDYYNIEVAKMILAKYGMSPMEALRAFVCSQTHNMLDFGAEALFEIWECEKNTGNPRNSIYIKGE